MRKFISFIFISIFTLAPAFDASEVLQLSGTAPSTRSYHSAKEVCPENSSIYCGKWYYGYGTKDHKSEFQANYYNPSGYGSQASVKLSSNGEVLRDVDKSTGSSSKAAVSTTYAVSHYYYAYYS